MTDLQSIRDNLISKLVDYFNSNTDYLFLNNYLQQMTVRYTDTDDILIINSFMNGVSTYSSTKNNSRINFAVNNTYNVSVLNDFLAFFTPAPAP